MLLHLGPEKALAIWILVYGQLIDALIQLNLYPYELLFHQKRSLTWNVSSLPSQWFHPKTNAIYATLKKEEEYSKSNNSELPLQFHRMRHLSRWEQSFRVSKNMSFEGDWDKTYNKRTLQDDVPSYLDRHEYYVVAPLNQGYGTHYAHIWVGSPKPQRQSVIVDTGSHFTAFPCKGCLKCGSDYHTDPYFQPQLSETFQHRRCHECLSGATCINDRCLFSQSYTEGSSWEAYQAEDLVYMGGRDMLAKEDPRNSDYAVEFLFGCLTSENGLFVTQLANGIMGMSAHQETLTKRLFDMKKIERNMFAMCFRRELATSKKGVSAGVMTLGGFDNRLDLSPMVYAVNVAASGWFTVYVKNVFIRSGGGQRATCELEEGQHILRIPLDLAVVNSGKGVIVDSGTTDTYLHKKVAKSFVSAWKKITKSEYNHKGILLSDDQLHRLPTILVQMKGYGTRSIESSTPTIGYAGTLDPSSPDDILLAIPATHYMEYSTTTGLYTSRLYFTESRGGVLGANSMQGHNVVFDWEYGRVGFAESACDYQDEHSLIHLQSVDKTLRRGFDCVLSDYILSRTCVEHVQSEVCDKDANENLEGIEVWSRLVESFGSESGMSCPEVMLLETPHTGRGPPEIRCSDGICSEIRPCTLQCSDIPSKQAVLGESQGIKCSSFWSQCDESCRQTYVTGIGKSDDKCYEVQRISRDCHKDKCGINDSCKIPFLVHAILVLRGAHFDYWDAQASDVMIRSILESVVKVGQMEVRPFDLGDVNILLISAWNDDTKSNEDMAANSGVKVVFRISFFNPITVIGSEIKENGKNMSVIDQDEENTKKKSLFPRNPFERIKEEHACLESVLSSIAKTALDVQSAIQDDVFIEALVDAMKHMEESNRINSISPWQDLFEKDYLIKQSSILSTWTIRNEVERNVTKRKSLLEMTPMANYSLSAPAIWMMLIGIGLSVIYGYEILIKRSHSLKECDDISFRSSRSSRISSSLSVDNSQDSDESGELLKQLFPFNGRHFGEFEVSGSQSAFDAEQSLSSHRSRTSRSTVKSDIELISLTSGRKSR
jgi:Xylanase inhibitor N-terminal